jgi:lysophospholipase L1-like esterase
VPEGEAGRKEGDEIDYNRIAAEVMAEQGVAINDLHAHALKKLPGIAVKKGDVHFNAAGCAHLAEKVAETVSARLKP